MAWRRIGGFLFVALAVLPSAAQTPGPAPTGISHHQTRQLTPNPTLNRAESLLQTHHWQAAHDLIVPWLKSNPKAPDRDRGLYLLAQVYFQGRDRIRAFYHLDELLDNFPESKLYFPALELQFDIADAYLNGYTEDFLGLPIITHYDEAIEMLYRIQERSPGSPIAERALKRTADYYFNTSQFDLASDAYGAFVRSYPRSPDVPRIKLREAFSSLAQFRGPKFDATPLIDARAQFKLIEAQYPDLAAQANVAHYVSLIDADLARKAYINADFYRRTGKLSGAVFMYRYLVRTYPNSHEADLARRQLPHMPQWALNQPAPAQSNPDAAAQNSPLRAPANGPSQRRQ